MCRFEALIDRNSLAIAKIYHEETGYKGLKNRVHDLIRVPWMGGAFFHRDGRLQSVCLVMAVVEVYLPLAAFVCALPVRKPARFVPSAFGFDVLHGVVSPVVHWFEIVAAPVVRLWRIENIAPAGWCSGKPLRNIRIRYNPGYERCALYPDSESG